MSSRKAAWSVARQCPAADVCRVAAHGAAVGALKVAVYAEAQFNSHLLILPRVELGRYAADGHHGWNLSEPEHNEEVLKHEAVVDATS